MDILVGFSYRRETQTYLHISQSNTTITKSEHLGKVEPIQWQDGHSQHKLTTSLALAFDLMDKVLCFDCLATFVRHSYL